MIQKMVGGDLTLLMRLGALLQDRVAVTEPALQHLVAGSHHAFLIDRRLHTSTDADLIAVSAAHGVQNLVFATAEDGFRVLALADEIGNPLLAALAPAAVVETTGLPAVVASLAPNIRMPVEELIAARADDQRAAALEQLRYAMPPLTVVSELMPMLLADGAEIVRERAIALLVAAGAHVGVVDTIRALQRGDEAALLRQAETLGRLTRPQQELAISATMAQLGRGQATPGLVAIARALSPLLAHHPSLERLIEQLLPRRLSLIDLVRALQDHDRGRIDAILARNLGHDAEQDAQLIVLLAAPTAPSAEHPLAIPALLERGLTLLLAPEAAPRERMALAAALRRLDSYLPVRQLGTMTAAREHALGRAFDTSIYWMLSELCRDGAIDAESGEILAGTCRRLLRDAGGPHLVAMLEQQLPALLPASQAARQALVEPTIETVARFHDDRSRDVVLACVLALGGSAIPGLWTAISDHPRPEVRLLCAELIPELTMRIGGEAPLREACERLLGLMARTVETNERVALASAAARIVVNPLLVHDADLHARIMSAASALGEHGLEAVGYLAASAACPAQVRQDLLQRMFHSLAEDVPDSPAETSTDPANQEVTYLLDDALSRHTDALPRVLRALEQVGGSDGVPGELRASVMAHLCRQWKRVSTWQVVWGPGNIRELGETIARLGQRPDCPPPQRVQAAEALLAGAAQLSIARAICRVFLAGNGPYLATLAGRAAARLVQLASEDYYADDERGELVEVLVDLLTIAELGKEDAALRRRLASLITTMHDNISSRTRLRLRYLRSELAPELAAKLDWA